MVRLSTLRRLVADEDGQDLIEYALLSGFIGLAGVAVFSGMSGSMQTAYNAWVTRADTAADMPDPISSP
jgi:Flp pilus assembly pilin Flp